MFLRHTYLKAGLNISRKIARGGLSSSEKIAEVLSKHFANGFRVNSPIELKRFRAYAINVLGNESSLPDDKLIDRIKASGNVFDGKVYAVSSKTKQRIKALCDDYFSSGAIAIFYAELYAKNENWLFEANVISENMLVNILLRLYPKLNFTFCYFGFTDSSIASVLESEILHVWGKDALQTYDQLAERLWFIPIERIKQSLAANNDFVRSSKETYSHISKIDISEDECEAVRNAAQQECDAQGHISIAVLPLGGIIDRNDKLSLPAIHNAVFRICLSDEYNINGKIVTRKGNKMDALTVVKNYCRTVDKCSLEDLQERSRTLTGEDSPLIPMEAGNAVLVRIEKDTYVADKHVCFDVDAIDEAIARFVTGDYLPLKSFTIFSSFPDCMQKWNLFLLESYCRRFSRRFRFGTSSANSRNAGAVIRSDCGLAYPDIMADAVANSTTPLQDSVVNRFLFESGYTGKSMTEKVVSSITRKAKAMRERRD